MQNTSELYKSIVSGAHWFSTKITIAGNELDETYIMSLNRNRPAMNESKPSIGGVLSSTLNLTILTPPFSIPRIAEIDVFVRAENGVDQSEWIPQGVYFIDTRKRNQSAGSLGSIRITAYDSMAKAEADYPSTNHTWPYLDRLVVAEIATAMGVTVDSRTYDTMTASYMISLPTGYNMRETLEHIAAAYGGNFVMTAENKLLLLPLYGLDPTITGNYLADENGDALVPGDEGWCILV